MLPTFAWSLTLAFVLALGSVFLWVARRASHAGDPIPALAARIRRRCTWVLATAALPITLVSLAYAPLRTEAAIPPATTIVDVVGHQWYWELSRTQIPVGELVVFRVTSADVNHGFAIYDEDLRLIAQTQAMPGYVNGLQVRFDHPGRYRILCLEYCGLVHHGMAAAVDVVAPTAMPEDA